MNKYQESLDNLIRVSCPRKVSCKECDFEKLCNSQAKGYVDTLQELVDNYEKLMKAFNDRKVLIKSITNNNGIGIFECEADVWATIGSPIVRLE